MAYTLTAIERRILQVVCTALMESNRPPSVKELTEAAGLRSVASLHWYLDRLQAKGLIRRDPTRARAIEVDCQALKLARPVPASATTLPAGEPATAGAATPTVEVQAGPPTGPGLAKTAATRERPPATDQGREVHPESAVVVVPLLGKVAAGEPILATGDEAEAIYRLPIDLVGYDRDLFMLRISGDSMREAGILDRDLVVIHHQRAAADGEIVLALIDEEATVKRLSRRGGRIRLLSDNPAVAPIEADEAQVLGKVVTVVRQLR
jgi:repressor LexA